MNNEELTNAMLLQLGKILTLENDYIILSKNHADHVREMDDIKAHIDGHERYQVLKKNTPNEDTNIKKLFAQIRCERDMLEVYLALARMRAGGV